MRQRGATACLHYSLFTGLPTAFATYPKYDVVAEHEVLVTEADFCIFITIVVHIFPCVERQERDNDS